MKNIKINLLKFRGSIIIIFILVSASCNDEVFFELEAPPVTEWQKIADLERAIAFPYNNTFVNTNAIGTWTHFIHLQMSDMVRQIGENPGWSSPAIYGRQTSNRGVQYVENKFGTAYQTIAATNKILEFLESDPFPNVSAADQNNNIDRIKGEALFLRAFNYFHLAQLYCPPYDPNGVNDSRVLVLRTTFPDNVDDALNNVPATTEEIYGLISADFREAMNLLPKQWREGMEEAYQFGRATNHAAAFYYAKTLLHMGDHLEALQILDSILEDPEKPRSLEEDPLTVFLNNSSSTPFDSPEVILGIYYANPLRTTPRHPMQWLWFINKTFADPNDFRAWWIHSMGNEVMEKANILVDGEWTDSWLNDKRDRLYHRWKGADPDAEPKGAENDEYMTSNDVARFVEVDDPILMCNKYFRVPLFQNFPFVRTAEALILRAGIKAENGDGPGAAQDLNVVRRRAWDESKSGPFVPLTNATFEQVDIEWIKELAFESDRVSFLQMFRKPIGPAERNVSPVEPPYSEFYWNIPIGETDFL